MGGHNSEHERALERGSMRFDSHKLNDVRELNIGLVGCGQVVKTLHLPALASICDLKIRWVCDSSLESARSVARAWNVRQVFEQISECTDVDAVLVATPVGTRREILEGVTKRRWHALCEKPFATSSREHRNMLECAARKGLKVGAGYMRRHHWSVERAREMVRTKVLGSLEEIVANEPAHLEATGLDLSSYRNNAEVSGGGVLAEIGCHLLDEVFFVSDAVSTKVRSCVQKMWNGYEVETIASGSIELGSGGQVALHVAVTGVRPTFAGIAFRCELGEIRLHLDPARNLEVYLGDSLLHRVEIPHPRPDLQPLQHVLAAFRFEWLHFLEAIRITGDWDLNRETGLMTTDFIEQCNEVAKASCFVVRE
jgi:predicted dehydrogenase